MLHLAVLIFLTKMAVDLSRTSSMEIALVEILCLLLSTVALEILKTQSFL